MRTGSVAIEGLASTVQLTVAVATRVRYSGWPSCNTFDSRAVTTLLAMKREGVKSNAVNLSPSDYEASGNEAFKLPPPHPRSRPTLVLAQTYVTPRPPGL